MLQNVKFFQSSTQLLHLPTVPPPSPQPQNIPATSSSSTSGPPKQLKLSRRELTISGSNTSLLLLFGCQTSWPLHSKAVAEGKLAADDQEQEEKLDSSPSPVCGNDRVPTKKAYLDISIDGEPAGRIVIGLYGEDVPAGAARFGGLVSGASGTSYRRKEFIKIMPTYVQHGGVRSYGVDVELASRAGSNLAVESLLEEWDQVKQKCPGVKNVAGSVSIIVRDPSKPPPKMKLIARQGKLEIDQEEVGKDPNGTEFAILLKDSPELDASALVIGRVLEGMEVVERIGQVKTVQENTSSPYFRVAKLIGDKRAVVAEKGFNRPYSKVIVTNCGLMD